MWKLNFRFNKQTVEIFCFVSTDKLCPRLVKLCIRSLRKTLQRLFSYKLLFLISFTEKKISLEKSFSDFGKISWFEPFSFPTRDISPRSEKNVSFRGNKQKNFLVYVSSYWKKLFFYNEVIQISIQFALHEN